MRARFGLVSLLAALGGLAAACSSLFDDPIQCRGDSDCARFEGAVCDTAQGVCTRSTGTTPDQEAGTEPADASPDTLLPATCTSTNKPTKTLKGDITSNITLSCDTDYVLQGDVYVRSGVTMTIVPGTTVKGDFASGGGLYVLTGARLVAEGSASAPIVFTSSRLAGSRAAGDWHGLFVLGTAPTSETAPLNGDPRATFGGLDTTDDSGSLRYVRIEYSKLGLKLGGVGRGTKLEFVSVRKTSEDCFAFVGGRVHAKHLVCQSPGDDQFDFRGGYDSKVQFLVGQGAGTGGKPDVTGLSSGNSRVTIYNATLIGNAAANVGTGLFLGGGAGVDYANFVVTGWNAGLDVTGAVGDPFRFRGSLVFGNTGAPVAYVEDPGAMDPNDPLFDDDSGFDEVAWYDTPENANATTDPGLPEPFDAKSPVFAPAASIGANAQVPPDDGFFEPGATYVGAFKDASDTWAGAWVGWDSR